jgi:acetyltransferase-like isoleucine patch superfamily enzyme
MSLDYTGEVAKSFIPEVLQALFRDLRESFRRVLSSTYYGNSVSASAHIGRAILDGHVMIGSNTTISGDVRIGKYTMLNDECVLSGGRIRIGNYCQFGPRVGIYAVNHSVRHVTTYNNSILFGGALKELVEQEKVDIGNDVWIGHGALVMPGATLGTGCVVGAGSVVTKAVPPYAIVAGCPAVLKRFRIAEPYATMLLNSHWWCLDPEELANFRDVFMELPEKTSKTRFEQLSKLGLAKAQSIGHKTELRMEQHR